MIRSRSALAILVVVSALVLVTGTQAADAAGGSPPTGGAENGTRLMDGTALYPRVIKLEHSGSANGRVIASAVTFEGGQGLGAVFASTDHGHSFSRIGTIADPDAANGLCCATLYELPRRVGDLPSGTLLWSASVGQDAGDKRRMTVPLWASTDHGRTWHKLATVATSPNFGGLWEPELTVSSDGRLVLYISDESRPGHSQLLAEATSRDGRSWTSLQTIVAAEDPELRPGMPVVRRMPNDTYVMSYEICGPGQQCRQRTRRSYDGVHWSGPDRLGTRVRTRDGLEFRHAPTISSYQDGTGRGRLLAVGQVLHQANGDTATGSGSTIFTTGTEPKRRWQKTPAPVRIADPYDNYCPNYSSALLPQPRRGTLLELASGYDEDGTCTTYFATGQLPD